MKKLVLVTGATGDIGHSISELLSANEYHLILHTTGKNKKSLSRLEKSIPQNMISDIFECDFEDFNSLELFCEKIKMKYKTIDCLVNNAGIGALNHLSSFSNNDIKRIIDINLIAPMIITKNLIPLLEASDLKRVINIGSTAALAHKELFSIYCASKHGLEAFTSCMYHEFKLTSQIKVTNIHPGRVETKMMREFFPKTRDEDIIMPQKISEMILFILKKNPYITDVTIKR